MYNLSKGFEAQFEPKQEQKLKSDQLRIQYLFQFHRVKLNTNKLKINIILIEIDLIIPAPCFQIRLGIHKTKYSLICKTIVV